MNLRVQTDGKTHLTTFSGASGNLFHQVTNKDELKQGE